MAYIEGRLVHDADSHLMEMADCLDPYFEKKFLQPYHDLDIFKDKMGNGNWIDKARALHSDTEFRKGIDENIMLRKNYDGHGAFLSEDRPRAVDQLGVASQLVFTTFCLGNFGLDQGNDMDLCYAAAQAHNRMMTDFCKVDPRLLATAYIPLEDFARANALTRDAIEMGAKALLVPSWCPQGHGPSHKDLFAVWAMAEEAGIPVLFHVGGEIRINETYKVNGLPAVKDFHGGDDNFTSVSYMPIPNSAMQTIATLIFDGVFDRFPGLKWGAIELGAAWLPGLLKSMDSAAHAFIRNEERLQNLSAKPSEIARRQLRVAPYPHEDVGWIIANSGKDMCMFSTDFPHVEGGRNPLKRFDTSLEGLSQYEIDGFYAENYIDLMGEGLASDLRRPAHLLSA
jgi:predicted TIM-barrel fold metal-dependent hydrolase